MDSARKPEAKPPVTATGIALKRLETYLAKELVKQSDKTAWDFYTRLWCEARKIAEAIHNGPLKRTYWKVEVEAYDNGLVKAAVTGSEEREASPQKALPYLCGRQFERPGMTATELWFNDKGKAEAFVADLRRPGNDRATTDF
jgi:hypothetical protein